MRHFMMLLLVGVIGAASFALAAPAEKVTSVEGITEYRLGNGLRVLLYRDSSRPTVTVNLTVLVGSRHEGYGEAGMAHLLEHMLFKGTADHPKIFQLLSERGAQFNGSTWLDRTNYFETLPASGDNLEFMISMEADRLINCPIKAEDLSSEFTVVRNEFERGENSPGRVLSERISSAAYDWHNYGKTTIGNRSDIERVPVDSLRRFYKRYYQPDNAVVVVAGRFEEANTLGLVEKYFGAIARPERKLEPTYTQEPAQDGEREVLLRRVGDVPIVGMAYHVPAGPDAEFAAVDVLAEVLSLQPSGPLYKALVETKKCASVRANARATHDPGLLEITADVRPGVDPQDVRQTIVAELDKVIANGVPQADVDRVRQRFMKRRDQLAANTSQLAVNLSEWAAQGDWRLFFLHRDRIEKVTAAQVQAAAAKYLKASNRTVGLFLPTKSPDRVAVAPAPDVEAMLKEYKGRADLAQGEDFDPSPANIEARTKLGTLPGGLKMAMLPKKTRGGMVQLHLTLRYGDETNLKGLVEACDLLPPLMAKATTNLSRQALADALDENKTSLSAGGGTGVATFTLQTKSANLPAALELLRQVLREPSLPVEELEIMKRGQLTGLADAKTQPGSLADNFIARRLRPFAADDVRYEPTIDEQIERVKGVSREQVERVYREYLGAANGEVVVVGDFEPGAVTAALTAALADWAPKAAYKRIAMPAAVPLASADESINTPDKANAQYSAAMVFPVKDTNADFAALVMVNRILGGGGNSRLWQRVREKEGLSYGVRSGFSASAFDPLAELSISAIVNPQNMTKLKGTVMEEFNRLASEGVTEAELKRARDSYLDQRSLARSQDGGLAGILGRELYAGRTIRREAELDEQVRALTVEQVSAAARKYLDAAHLVSVSAGDLGGGGAK
jgi:zinc protease